MFDPKTLRKSAILGALALTSLRMKERVRTQFFSGA